MPNDQHYAWINIENQRKAQREPPPYYLKGLVVRSVLHDMGTKTRNERTTWLTTKSSFTQNKKNWSKEVVQTALSEESAGNQSK